jgi:hypothetical protein
VPSKKSGGKRAVEKKHAAREAARRRAGQKLPDIGKLVGEPPEDARELHEYAARVAALNLRAEMKDKGLPPEQQRDRIGRRVKELMETLDGAKLSQELRELYEAAKADKEPPSKESTDDATRLEGGDGGVPSAETDLL